MTRTHSRSPLSDRAVRVLRAILGAQELAGAAVVAADILGRAQADWNSVLVLHNRGYVRIRFERVSITNSGRFLLRQPYYATRGL